MWSLVVLLVLCPNNVRSEVEIGTPDDSVFYRKIGNLYPSVNVGHIRLQVNLSQVRGISTTICNHVPNLEPYLNYLNGTAFTNLSAEIKAAYNGLPNSEKEKVPSDTFKIQYRSILGLLNRLCAQSLENSQLLDEVLGGQPITVASNRGKRQALVAIAAGLSLLFSGYNTYELQRISS